MALKRSIAGSIRARSPFSLRSRSSSVTNNRKQWKRESDAIGRNLSEQGWSEEDISSSGGHDTLVDPSLADFAIIHVPPVSPPTTRDGHVKDVEANREDAAAGGHAGVGAEEDEDLDDGPRSESGEEVGRAPHPIQRIKPSFILSPRPFIPGITHPPNARRSLSFHREPTPTASLSRKGSTRSHPGTPSRRSSGKRMSARRMDARRSRLSVSWPSRALSTLRRKRIAEGRLAEEGSTVRLGFDSAILLTGLEGGDSVDEFGVIKRELGSGPENIPLPESPGRSSISLPLGNARRPTISSSSSSSSFEPVTPPAHYHNPYPFSKPTTVLKTGKKFRPYYTRPLSAEHDHHDGVAWDIDPVASTYLFIQSIIAFSEPVALDLNFLEGVKLPGVTEWRGREVPMGRAL